jgi:tagatose-6-phosphate ketose/aldose isomerase
VSALSEMLSMPNGEKVARGVMHTAAEIAQQPDTWLATAELFRKNRPAIIEFLSSTGLNPASVSRPAVFLVGAGTSDYIGQALAYLLRRHWRCDVVAVPSTDLLTHLDNFVVPEKKYLWISFSRSGDSPEGVALLDKIRNTHPDIHHLVISCNPTGRMIRDNAGKPGVLGLCLDDAVNDRGLAMTSSFSNMVVFGQCLANINDSSGYEKVLPQLVQAGRSFLPQAADCAAALANGRYPKVCFVGSGPLRAVARESALKLLELTAGQTLTMSESALGLRHGPLAALDQDTLLVCFLSGDARVQRYELDLLEEIKKKELAGCTVLVAGDEVSAGRYGADHVLSPSSRVAVEDDYRPAVDVIFGQLLGLFFSLQWNLRPDCPSANGAISRVVQNVTIHS